MIVKCDDISGLPLEVQDLIKEYIAASLADDESRREKADKILIDKHNIYVGYAGEGEDGSWGFIYG